MEVKVEIVKRRKAAEFRTNHWLPKVLGVAAITLGRRIYVAKRIASPRLIRHELEHVRQQEADGFMFFLKYLWHYLDGITAGLTHDEAYRSIPYEVEARKAEGVE